MPRLCTLIVKSPCFVIIQSISCKRVALPMVRPLFLRTGAIHERQVFLVLVKTDIGTVLSEVAPFEGLSTESIQEVEQQLFWLQQELSEKEIPFVGGLANIPSSSDLSNSVRFALESAAFYLNLRHQSPTVPVYPEIVHINGLVQANDPLVMEKVEDLAVKNVKAIKVKVGQLSPEKDAAIVRDIHSVLGSTTAVRVDANRAWSLEQATVFCESVAQLSLEYIEEPLKNLRDIAVLANRTFVPWAIDESLRLVSLDAVLDLPALEAVIIKPMVLGFNESYRLKVAALQAKKQVTLSNVFTSPVAASMELLLAKGLEHFAHGYDTLNMVRSEALHLPPLMQRGKLYIEGQEVEDVIESLSQVTL